MMWNPRENNADRSGGKRSIGIAINKDKTSQCTLKWALDNIVSKHETLKLVQVKERSPSPLSIQGNIYIMSILNLLF